MPKTTPTEAKDESFLNPISNLEEVLSTCLSIPTRDPDDSDAPRGLPPLFWGPPGIGKSQRVREAARTAMLTTETLYAGTKQPDDFSLPLPDGQGGVTVIPGLPQIRRLIERGEGLLFLDEISCARPAVQSALLSLVQERYAGDVKLPPGIRIAAAANPADVAAGGWDLEAPTANRFLHFDCLPPTPHEWAKWFMQEGSVQLAPAQDLWVRVADHWASVWPRSKGLLMSFMHKRGATLLNALPGPESPQRGRAWPSSRSWDMAIRAYATCEALNRPHLQSLFIRGAVGEAGATEFIAWVQAMDLPDPAAMLEQGWTPSRHRPDIALAAYTAMTTYVIRPPAHLDPRTVAAQAWGVLLGGFDHGLADIIKMAAGALVNAGLDGENDEVLFASARPVIRRLKGVVQAT